MSIDDPRHLAGRGGSRIWAGFKSRVAAAFDFHLSKIIDAERRDLLIRFVAIGFVNTAFGYGVFAVIYAISQSHRAAIVLATAGAHSSISSRRVALSSATRSYPGWSPLSSAMVSWPRSISHSWTSVSRLGSTHSSARPLPCL